MKRLKVNFILVYAASGILIVLLSLFMVRLINTRYEKRLEIRNEGLSQEVLSLSRLNHDLFLYQEKISDRDRENESRNTEETHSKKRILTYSKDEIVSIETDKIAYIFTENTLTYIVCLDGKTYHSSNSLDDLFQDLDKTYFFRANRQVIVSIKGIEKIYKYDSNRLKIDVNPKAPMAIIVSKNRVSEFKNWLSL